MTIGPLNHTPKTNLTLSAVPGLLPEDAEAASAIERELEAIDAGGPADRLIDYVWPANIGDERARPIITEAELRLLDGNR